MEDVADDRYVLVLVLVIVLGRSDSAYLFAADSETVSTV